MSDQRHPQLQNSYIQTSHHASATSGDVPSPAPLHAVAAEPDTDAATEYELPPRQQLLGTVTEQSDAITEGPDSDPLPSPPAWRTGDALGLDAVIPVEYRS